MSGAIGERTVQSSTVDMAIAEVVDLRDVQQRSTSRVRHGARSVSMAVNTRSSATGARSVRCLAYPGTGMMTRDSTDNAMPIGDINGSSRCASPLIASHAT